MKNPNETTPDNERQRNGPVIYALVFGLFLGLSLLKFGNPVILDSKVVPPTTFAEALSQAWPPRWSVWMFTPLVIAGVFLSLANKPRWPGSKWLWLLPIVWFVWQIISAGQTVDTSLTTLTIAHFAGCLACWFIGVWLLGEPRSFRFVLIGLLAAFTFCLVRAVDQKLFEFPRERQALMEGERTGWTNFSPELILQLKSEGIIINTNGSDITNPLMRAKYEKGRVFGTLVYPNALAGAILLLFPATLTLAVIGTQRFRRPTRLAAIALTMFLGIASLFWTGSKSGWLIALGVLAVWLFRLNWSRRLKWTVLALVLVVGTAAFAVRFHNYFASGATSVGARFDYWRAAVQNTAQHPLLGSGPGTFYRAYEKLKQPESEMARLTHNDYLEQFSDSGIPSGLSYLAWIVILFTALSRKLWRTKNHMRFAIFLGLLGWFAQALSEFGLYIPALAWTAFALAGSAFALNTSDKNSGGCL
jgi:hypothetical protein